MSEKKRGWIKNPDPQTLIEWALIALSDNSWDHNFLIPNPCVAGSIPARRTIKRPINEGLLADQKPFFSTLNNIEQKRMPVILFIHKHSETRGGIEPTFELAEFYGFIKCINFCYQQIYKQIPYPIIS